MIIMLRGIKGKKDVIVERKYLQIIMNVTRKSGKYDDKLEL